MTRHSKAKHDEKVIVKVDREIEEIISIFFKTLNTKAQSALELLKQNNYQEIQMWGHTLKGVGAGYGFDAITELGRSLERAARFRKSTDISELVDDLSTYLE